jgi:ABC-2 type transport system ATP-binding protein
MMNNAVEVRDLVVVRGGREVLSSLVFTIASGGVTGLLGPSGCGKSTLMRALVGVQKLAGGTVRAFGTEAGHASLRDRIGYVTQAASVYDDLTVAENLTFFARVLGVDRGEVDAAVEAVDLADHRDQVVGRLSGGERSRVSLAVALLKKPDLLVLDEPTAGVDLHSQQAFADVLGSVAASGATVLLVAHELGALKPLIHRTVVLQDGRITYDGPPRAGEGLHAFHDHAHPESPSGPTVLDSGWPM